MDQFYQSATSQDNVHTLTPRAYRHIHNIFLGLPCGGAGATDMVSPLSNPAGRQQRFCNERRGSHV